MDALLRKEYRRMNGIPLGPVDPNTGKSLPAITPEMNVIDGQRIGWERKQEYLYKLGDYASQGYITHAEWAARLKWVENAKTIGDVEKAFSDLALPELESRLEKVKKPVKKPVSVKSRFMAAIVVYDLSFATFDAVTGNWWAVLGMILLAVLSLVLAVKFRKES